MVQPSVMTVLMAAEEPVFHDFLGIAGQSANVQLSKVVGLDAPNDQKLNVTIAEEIEGEASTKASSMNSGRFEASSAPAVSSGAFYKAEVDNKQGKRRDITSSMDSLQERRGMEAWESSHLLKDNRKSRHQDVAMDDLHLAMQPPRLSSKCPNPHPSSAAQEDFHTAVSKKWESLRPVSLKTVMFGPTRTGHAALQTDKTSANSLRESNLAPQRSLPPADEGSRTGLKGSGVASILNSASGNTATGTACPNPLPNKSKLWSQNTGSESTFVASQQTTPLTSRQLTIFYGGQAHVFDDVPPDKADAIMALAGSSGRSWSTVYSPRPKVSVPFSASEGSLSTFDRGREKRVCKASTMDGFSSLAMSTEMHNAAGSSAQLGHGADRTGHTHLPEVKFGQLSCIGSGAKKKEGREKPPTHMSTSVDELI